MILKKVGFTIHQVRFGATNTKSGFPGMTQVKVGSIEIKLPAKICSNSNPI